jgi:hypothetical protein
VYDHLWRGRRNGLSSYGGENGDDRTGNDAPSLEIAVDAKTNEGDAHDAKDH